MDPRAPSAPKTFSASLASQPGVALTCRLREQPKSGLGRQPHLVAARVQKAVISRFEEQGGLGPAVKGTVEGIQVEMANPAGCAVEAAQRRFLGRDNHRSG
jgi:hypothetical protein